ncbi:hypothetical protein ABQF34_12625 [Mycolicibacterium boenickei]
MSQMLQVLLMLAVPAAVLATLRCVVKRQERRAETAAPDSAAISPRPHA